MTELEIEQLIQSEIRRPRQGGDHICRLSACHNADLADWCGRHLRRRPLLRGTAATCLLVLFAAGINKAYADSGPQPNAIQYVLGDFSPDQATRSLTQLVQHL